MDNIDLGQIILFSTSVIGFLFGIWQLMLKRRFEKNDKLVDRRYDAYQGFMKHADETSYKVRIDPDNLFSLINKYFSGILSNDANESKKSLNEFNPEISKYTKKNLEPLQIVNAELNKLKLICSKKLPPKIDEYKELVEYISNITSSNLELITKEPGTYYKLMMSVANSEQVIRMKILLDEILELMRKEINNRN